MSKKTFNIDKSLYPEKVIQEAIDIFQWYTINYVDGVIVIDDEDAQRIFDELMNYILSIFSENTVWA